jgi:hypothetical protein
MSACVTCQSASTNTFERLFKFVLRIAFQLNGGRNAQISHFFWGAVGEI